MLQNFCDNRAEWSLVPLWDVLTAASCTNTTGWAPLWPLMAFIVLHSASFAHRPDNSTWVWMCFSSLSITFQRVPKLFSTDMHPATWELYGTTHQEMSWPCRDSELSLYWLYQGKKMVCNTEAERQLDFSCMTQNCYLFSKYIPLTLLTIVYKFV